MDVVYGKGDKNIKDGTYVYDNQWGNLYLIKTPLHVIKIAINFSMQNCAIFDNKNIRFQNDSRTIFLYVLIVR